MNLIETLTFKAKIFAKHKHMGQKDDCGKDYFDGHIQQVYALVLQLTDDENILCAALLHDTIEDTDTTYKELVENFNVKIADLVMEVTHEGQKDSKGFYFPRLKSRDAILIKFADRLSNLCRMESWSKDRQEHYLKKSKFWKSE
jgi:(p)ppGpp synthase/HD superfamily hydrolase